MTKDIKFLVSIIKRSANLAKKHFKVSKKLNNDLVTDCDLIIEKFLIKNLKKKYKDFGIISEEFNNNSETIQQNCFIIDPIDGTLNFANGGKLWGIQIAIIKDYVLAGAVIYIPKLKELYYADETGAYLNKKRLSVKDNNLSSVVVMNIKNSENAKIYKYLEDNKIVFKNRNYGVCCYDYGALASGIVNGYLLSTTKLHIWDYIMGDYIAKQAGVKRETIIIENSEFWLYYTHKRILSLFI